MQHILHYVIIFLSKNSFISIILAFAHKIYPQTQNCITYRRTWMRLHIFLNNFAIKKHETNILLHGKCVVHNVVMILRIFSSIFFFFILRILLGFLRKYSTCVLQSKRIRIRMRLGISFRNCIRHLAEYTTFCYSFY